MKTWAAASIADMTRLIAFIAALMILSADPVFVQGAQRGQPPPVDVAGEWTLYLETPSPGILRLNIAQKDSRLSGFVGNQQAEHPMTGIVEGNHVKIMWTVWESGQRIDIVATGDALGSSISGTATLGDKGQVEMYAERFGGG